MSERLPIDQILTILAEGEMQISGRFLYGSNYTFLVQVHTPQDSIAAVYKPSRGERPLWDFARGTLAAREVAAYISSQALGWELVPPTVFREEAPAGSGSLQLYVDVDLEHHYFNFSELEKQRLRPVALFDLLVNNADRKGGHVLISPEGHIWSIDHGICFHREDKLRTVIWDFSNEIIPDELLENVRSFLEKLKNDDGLRREYLKLLSTDEIDALVRRAERLLRERYFPQPESEWSYPWPLV
jgi:uncharacterized repeat protein (TIGR03843 family)